MRCLSEQELEMYILKDRFELETTNPDINQHLDECTFCEGRFLRFIDYYSEFERVLADPVTHEEFRFVQNVTNWRTLIG